MTAECKGEKGKKPEWLRPGSIARMERILELMEAVGSGVGKGESSSEELVDEAADLLAQWSRENSGGRK